MKEPEHALAQVDLCKSDMHSHTEKVIKGGAWYLCECYIRPANRR